MLVIPAVDVRGGRTVRLRQGDYERETVFDGSPADTARRFIDEGAGRLHIVDLDSARGRPDELTTAAVRDALDVALEAGREIEIGGGVRDEARARAWLDAGATAVVIGSVAVIDPPTARAICDMAPGRVLLALDVHDGRARTQGWTEAGDAADKVLRTWNAWPAAGVIYTDTARDGMLGGPDLVGLQRCRTIYAGPVFLSGGMRNVDDALAAAAHGAAGAVVGRALLDGDFDLRRAIESLALVS
ncbi:MAG: HisA/HisF-related TIM barrel protein [Candidatus Dormibacteria bacterium]